MLLRYLKLFSKRNMCYFLLVLCSYLIICQTWVQRRIDSAKYRNILSFKVKQQAAQLKDEIRMRNNEENIEDLVENKELNSDAKKIRRQYFKSINSMKKNKVMTEANINLTENYLEKKTLAIKMGTNSSSNYTDVELLLLSSTLTKEHPNLNFNSQPYCADIDKNENLIGRVTQGILLIKNLKEADVYRVNSFLKPGGHWKPTECVAKHKVAIIIPFRDRQTHLTRLVDFLIPVLKRQLLDFKFIVTEQYGHNLFNKGRIMNAAFLFAEKLNVSCVIFHDVDMFLQHDHNFYGCPKSPRHIGAFVSNLGYQLWYKEIVGGALAISVKDYRAVNGYSNMYWGWGGEDDDMGKRILAHNITIERPDPKIGRFSMLKHVKRKRIAPKLVYKLVETAGTRWKTDGLNQVSWKVVKVVVRPLYYHLYVDVGNPPPEWK